MYRVCFMVFVLSRFSIRLQRIFASSSEKYTSLEISLKGEGILTRRYTFPWIFSTAKPTSLKVSMYR